MIVSELIEKLKTYPSYLEVRILNSAIEDDEVCPTFEIDNISSAKENAEESEEQYDSDFVIIEIYDATYIDNEYKG